jgi:hypothetical protein
MMKISLNRGTAITALACLAAAGLASMALQDCASEPTPRCAVPPGGVVASYYAMTPPMPAPGAMGNPDCSTWVPPGLQGGCNSQCAPIGTNGPGGEFFNLETGYPLPNDPSWTTTPYSMSILNQWVQARILDYKNNVSQWADAGQLPGPWVADYPFVSNSPANPPQDPKNTTRPYSWAPFDSVYPNSGICTVQLAESNATLPDIPAHPIFGTSAACAQNSDCMEGGTAPCICQDGTKPPCMDDAGNQTGACSDTADQPQTQLDYKWSNVKVVADPSDGNIGGQIFADLTITQDTCTQSFHVAIMSPNASCNGMTADGGIVKDETQCLGNPANSDNYPTIGDATTMSAVYGSGIYPAVPVQCAQFYPAQIEGGPPPTIDYECQPTLKNPP